MQKTYDIKGLTQGQFNELSYALNPEECLDDDTLSELEHIIDNVKPNELFNDNKDLTLTELTDIKDVMLSVYNGTVRSQPTVITGDFLTLLKKLTKLIEITEET